jgi:hypothetical protein
MRSAGIAGALAMLVPCLVGCGGNGETSSKQDVRLEIRRALALPDDARLGNLECGKVVPLDMLACETTCEGPAAAAISSCGPRAGLSQSIAKAPALVADRLTPPGEL